MDVLHFTDPACPFAFSAEPVRLRLRWHYGDQLTWRTVLVGLHESAEAAAAKGLTPQMLVSGMRSLQEQHGMPIDWSERPRVNGSVQACRAVVATRRNRPELADAILRRLRVRTMGGELLDDDATIDGAAGDVGIDAAELASWMADPATEQALRDDMAAARSPHPAALLLDHKLADAEDGGRRYTCPSYELRDGDEVVAVPGLMPWEAYDVAVANLATGLDRRDPPTEASKVLQWADEPLATAEVAALLGVDRSEARVRLVQAGAGFEPVGADGYWSLAR